MHIHDCRFLLKGCVVHPTDEIDLLFLYVVFMCVSTPFLFLFLCILCNFYFIILCTIDKVQTIHCQIIYFILKKSLCQKKRIFWNILKDSPMSSQNFVV